MALVAREVWLEEKLWDDFSRIAEQNRKSVDQVISELMQDYIYKTNEERQRRIDAVEYANASVELEGFKLSPEYLERQKQFIDGKISIEELVEHDLKER